MYEQTGRRMTKCFPCFFFGINEVQMCSWQLHSVLYYCITPNTANDPPDCLIEVSVVNEEQLSRYQTDMSVHAFVEPMQVSSMVEKLVSVGLSQVN